MEPVSGRCYDVLALSGAGYHRGKGARQRACRWRLRHPQEIDYAIIFTIHAGSVIHANGLGLDWVGWGYVVGYSPADQEYSYIFIVTALSTEPCNRRRTGFSLIEQRFHT